MSNVFLPMSQPEKRKLHEAVLNILKKQSSLLTMICPKKAKCNLRRVE